ncbi:MAG: glycoside hydrolase family 5 protein [Bifidobacteriaceae bacterium]|jgi:aryl-phospho-beta-D-glucosidase BglC (GH1 family)|nr:glycoside hydrolase family 5 protein [Bifidobacteriaceae bacterium]
MESRGSGFLRTSGTQIIDGLGKPIRLRGVNLGGILNMEHFVTGFAGTETMMRREVARALGEERAREFFDRQINAMFGDDDAALLEGLGVNCVRIGFNYRHFEDDQAPFELKTAGLAALDRVVELCARRRIYSILDLHALPGGQNAGWHADNPTHLPLFWQHRHFQDRAVWLWEKLASHYRSNRWVAGYNLLNEPADPTGQAVAAFYRRVIPAIRAVDPDHILFIDGNRYATEFDIFDEPAENAVYTCHDYAIASLRAQGAYPGVTAGEHWDAAALEAKFLERSQFARSTGTPVYVGEFGPIYTGRPDRDAELYQILDDQLEIYRRHSAGWCTWMYKDLGRQGLVGVRADTPYRRLYDPFVAKKQRLATDAWGTDYSAVAHLIDPIVDLVRREFPAYDGYPWGTEYWVHTLVPHIVFAEPMVADYAAIMAGLDDRQLAELADSFQFANCDTRQGLADRLRADLAAA